MPAEGGWRRLVYGSQCLRLPWCLSDHGGCSELDSSTDAGPFRVYVHVILSSYPMSDGCDEFTSSKLLDWRTMPVLSWRESLLNILRITCCNPTMG